DRDGQILRPRRLEYRASRGARLPHGLQSALCARMEGNMIDTLPVSKWLRIHRGEAGLILSIPHSGVQIPEDCWHGIGEDWLVRNDTDWDLDKLYDFAAGLGATVVQTLLSRTVIDVNRDPSGK